MARSRAILIATLCVSGCLPFVDEDKRAELVPSNPFAKGPQDPSSAKFNYTPASAELSERVDFLGRRILAANPQIGLKPLFATMGAPHVEIFHTFTQGDASMVFVTSGLVQQCKNEAELAAVLSHELGKMVAEREERTTPQTRKPQTRPPSEVNVGSAGGGYSFTGDQTRLAELGKFEKENPKKQKTLPRPDPEALARAYLVKAGYQENDLKTVHALLQAAERNYQLEKQFRALGTRWQPPAWNGAKATEKIADGARKKS